LIVLYVTYIDLDVKAFHESIGEILFIGWVIAYLFAVIRIENLPVPSRSTKNSTPPEGIM